MQAKRDDGSPVFASWVAIEQSADKFLEASRPRLYILFLSDRLGGTKGCEECKTLIQDDQVIC